MTDLRQEIAPVILNEVKDLTKGEESHKSTRVINDRPRSLG